MTVALKNVINDLHKNRKKLTKKIILDSIDGIDSISGKSKPAEKDKKLVNEYMEILLGQYTKLSPEQKKSMEMIKAFINSNDACKFTNFDKNIIALQLLARVMDPKRVRQNQEQVCGVAALTHIIAEKEPSTYVKFVIDLATKGEANFRLKQTDDSEDFKIKLSGSNIFKRGSSHSLRRRDNETDHLDECDFISLIGFRAAENKLLSYKDKSSNFLKSLFGVTTPGEIKSWMKKAGYSDIHSMKLKKPEDILKLREKLKDGYSAIFLTTSHLANYLVYDDKLDKYPPELKQMLMEGHYIQIKAIDYNHEEGEVKLTILTWGEEKVDVPMPLEVFKKIKGQSKALTGITPHSKHRLEENARQCTIEALKITHPIKFINNVKNFLKEVSSDLQNTPNGEYKNYARKFFSDIEKLLNQAADHNNGQSWLESAKIIQVKIFEFQRRSERLSTFDKHPISVYNLINYSLNNFISSDIGASKQYMKSFIRTNNYTPQDILLDNFKRSQHVPSLIRLIQLGNNNDDKIEKEIDLILKLIDKKEYLLTDFEKAKIFEALDPGLQNKYPLNAAKSSEENSKSIKKADKPKKTYRKRGGSSSSSSGESQNNESLFIATKGEKHPSQTHISFHTRNTHSSESIRQLITLKSRELESISIDFCKTDKFNNLNSDDKSNYFEKFSSLDEKLDSLYKDLDVMDKKFKSDTIPENEKIHGYSNILKSLRELSQEYKILKEEVAAKTDLAPASRTPR